MKNFKTVLFLVIMVVAMVVTPSLAFAENQQKNGTNVGPSTDQLASVILSNLENVFDINGNKQLEIVDFENLNLELEAINAPISATQLQDVINNFNYSIVAEQGNGIITTMTTDVANQLNGPNPYSRKLITCSNVMGAIGLIHAGSYSAAAYLLGLTGPAALAIPLIVSTAYYLGSLLC